MRSLLSLSVRNLFSASLRDGLPTRLGFKGGNVGDCQFLSHHLRDSIHPTGVGQVRPRCACCGCVCLPCCWFFMTGSSLLLGAGSGKPVWRCSHIWLVLRLIRQHAPCIVLQIDVTCCLQVLLTDMLVNLLFQVG